MRRVFGLLAAAALLFCCGCQNAETQLQKTPLPAAFTAEISVTHGVLKFEADFAFSADGTAQTTLTAPEAVASLEITQNKTGCRFAFLGLTLETPPAFLPDASFAKLLYAAVCALRDGTADCTAASYGDSQIYTCKTDAGDLFTLSCNAESGTPQTLAMDGQDLRVDFVSFQAQE